jgi:hypothetical protein
MPFGAVPFSVNVNCGFLRVESPEGGTNDHAKVSGPLRKEEDGRRRCGVGNFGEAPHVFLHREWHRPNFVYASADLSRPYRVTVTAQIYTSGLFPGGDLILAL